MINLKTKDWQLDNVEAVLFDKDGTFIDVHIYWGRIIHRRIEAVIAKYNLDKGLYDEFCLSLGLDTKTNKLIPQGPIALLPREEVLESLSAKLKQYGIDAGHKDLSDIFNSVNTDFQKEIYTYIKLLPGAKELFEKLKSAGVKTAVVTSDGRENTKHVLKHLGIENYFDLIMGREDCHDHKRTGIPAIQAVEKLNTAKNKTITVGDAPMDGLMAKNGGLKGSILVATGQLPIEELKQISPYTIRSMNDLEVV